MTIFNGNSLSRRSQSPIVIRFSAEKMLNVLVKMILQWDGGQKGDGVVEVSIFEQLHVYLRYKRA